MSGVDASAMRLSLLGAPAIAQPEAARALHFERRSQLLVYLALKRTWVGRAELAALLWPDQDSKLALTNLRKALHRLQFLPGAESIEVQGSALRCEAETDVKAFEIAVREQRIADALPLWRGDFLSGFDDGANEAWTRWLSFERDRLRAMWRSAAQQQLAGDMNPGEAIDLAARLVDADPLDEEALQHYMQWLSHAGQVARARQAYRGHVERLKRDLGLAPSARLRDLFDTIGASASKPKAEAASGKSAGTDGFVGRAVELRRIADLLAQDDCRLLSLIGPGGVGKTRLAQRVMQDFARHFDGGASFVSLEDVASTSDVGGRLAQALGITLKPRQDPLDQAIEALRPLRTLLVLDNLEQLVAAAPLIERLLAECGQIKIVVTSRVRLALASEWLLPLDGLPCPDDEDVEHIESFDAARLFISAAGRVQPQFTPVAEAAAIVDICRHLEGLPLAIELAAAWTRVLSCAAIAEELRRSTELLRAGDATQPARHASIDAVFGQSWQLLVDIERETLARLSVFAGSFSPEAAKAVSRAPLAVLASLVDKSLVRKEGNRLRLHPLVQQFAAVRLGDSAGRTAAEAAHARHFHEILHQLRDQVEHGDRDALSRIDAEFENCRLAWRWSVRHEDTVCLTHSVYALTHYCDHRSRLEEGLALFREADAALSADRASHARAIVLGKAAHLEYRLDRYADAMAVARRALEALGSVADADARTQCLMVLGTSEMRLGNNREAVRYLQESLEMAPLCVDPGHRAKMLTALAVAHKALGDYDVTLRMSLEALAEQRRLADVGGEAISLNNLGSFYIERLQPERASEYLKQALVLCERNGLRTTQGAVLVNLTLMAAKLEQYDAAEMHGARALELAQAIGNRFYLAFLKFQFASLAAHRRRFSEARAELKAGMELALIVGRPVLLIAGLACFGEIVAATGETVGAQVITRFAADHPLTAPLDREDLLQRLQRWGSAKSLPDWPGLSLEETAHRIVVETDTAHAALIGAIVGTNRAPRSECADQASR